METIKGKNDIVERTFSFALHIVTFCRQLEKTSGSIRSLSLQVLRSGTSIGANVEEAQAGQSKADFISKMTIALKEARETCYWLRLIREASLVDKVVIDRLFVEASELARILGAIVARSKQSRSS